MSGRRRSSRRPRPSRRAREADASAGRRRLERQQHQQLLRQREARQRELQLRRQQRANAAETSRQYGVAETMLGKMSVAGQTHIPDAPSMEDARDLARQGYPIVRALPPHPHKPFYFDIMTPGHMHSTYINPEDVREERRRLVEEEEKAEHQRRLNSLAARLATPASSAPSSPRTDISSLPRTGGRGAIPSMMQHMEYSDDDDDEEELPFTLEELESEKHLWGDKGGGRRRRKKKTRRKRRGKRRKRKTKGRRRR